MKPEAAADLDALIARMTTVRTARAWVYKEQLREILERKHAFALVYLRHAQQSRADEGRRRYGSQPS